MHSGAGRAGTRQVGEAIRCSRLWIAVVETHAVCGRVGAGVSMRKSNRSRVAVVRAADGRLHGGHLPDVHLLSNFWYSADYTDHPDKLSP